MTILTGANSQLVYQRLWQPPVLSGGPVSRDISFAAPSTCWFPAIRDMSGASGSADEGNENLVYPSPWHFKRSLTCCKILLHGTSGFTSHPKEYVLRIFISLKNPSPWPGLNPQPLGPVASTLTTTPPRRRPWCVLLLPPFLLLHAGHSHCSFPLNFTFILGINIPVGRPTFFQILRFVVFPQELKLYLTTTRSIHNVDSYFCYDTYERINGLFRMARWKKVADFKWNCIVSMHGKYS
jgi:hypothetical protein